MLSNYNETVRAASTKMALRVHTNEAVRAAAFAGYLAGSIATVISQNDYAAAAYWYPNTAGSGWIVELVLDGDCDDLEVRARGYFDECRGCAVRLVVRQR